MREGMIATGIGLIGLAVLPTPDDVTIISPVLQFTAGLTLLGFGVFLDDKKE